MKRFALCLIAIALMAGCKEDKESTGGIVYATEDTPGTTPTPAPARDSQEARIAKCLTAKGAVLYGANWCTYTKQQIASFKDGFEYLRYVECTEQATLCKSKGIAGYPTWIIDGTHLAGYRSPTSVATAAGCSW